MEIIVSTKVNPPVRTRIMLIWDHRLDVMRVANVTVLSVLAVA
jgi:hypothetical protein